MININQLIARKKGEKTQAKMLDIKKMQKKKKKSLPPKHVLTTGAEAFEALLISCGRSVLINLVFLGCAAVRRCFTTL